MAYQLIGIILYVNVTILALSYFYIYKHRKLIGFQLGMNISIVMGGMIAIAMGVLLIYQFPFQFVSITIISTLTGITVGSLFGGLFDYQTLLTGYGNGLMMGIMAPMVGAAANNSTIFIYFIEGAYVLSMILVLLSIKHS